MAFEFEALVGHLYIVNGRAINMMPPGALVEVAPKKAARGREMDTFFTLVLPSGESTGPSSFYEQMAKLAAEQYFSSSGSVTSGVRTLFSTLNQNLFEHNTSHQRRYEASMICAVLHGDDLFIARVGSGVAMLHHADDVQHFPTTFESVEKLAGPPLGFQPVPDIKMTRYRVLSDTRMILADTGLAEIEAAALLEALQRPDISEVLAQLKQLNARQITAQIAEFVPPEEAATLPVLEVYSTSAESTVPAPTSESPLTAAATLSSQAEGELVISRATEIRSRTQKSAGTAAVKVAGGLDGVNKIITRISEEPEEGGRRRWFTSSLTNGLVVFIPVVIVLLVVAMWLGGTGQSEFELCVNEATQAASVARQVPANDRSGILAAWSGALVIIERCNEIRAGDVQLAAVVREGQTVIDQLNLITRRDTITIASFPNADLTKVTLRGDDIYVLDDRNDLVYRVTLSGDGRSMVAQQQVPRMRRGAAAGQYTVGDIFDITWAEDGSGLSQGNVLISIDRSGLIVEYSPTFLSQGVQSLLGTETWVNPVRVLVWQGRLYILDPGASQIWRYDPSGESFPNAPREYFTGANRYDLTGAVDFGIDDNGRVYILFADGSFQVFRSSEPVSFGFAGFPSDIPPSSATAMYLNTNPVAPGIYLIDRTTRTVYETSLAGTFGSSYRNFNEDLFAGLSDVVADETKRIIYVLSGNSILALPK